MKENGVNVEEMVAQAAIQSVHFKYTFLQDCIQSISGKNTIAASQSDLIANLLTRD